MSENTINFSVIIPLYNKSGYIRKTINSVLSQTYKNFEIIIVNDGSTDDSLKIVKEYENDKIKIYSKLNSGVSDTRNYGVNKANYDYIAFLDADDVFLPNHLGNLYNLIKQYPNNDLYCTAYDIVCRNGKTNSISCKNDENSINFILEDYCLSSFEMRYSVITSSSVCIKKSLFIKSNGFNIDTKYGEDLDLWLRLSTISKPAYSTIPTVVYYVESDNNAVSSKKTPLKYFADYLSWYDLNYSNKKSLYTYTSYIIVRHLLLFLSKKNINSFHLLITQIIIKTIKSDASILYYIIKVVLILMKERLIK